MTKILLNGRPLRVLWCSDAPWATSGYSNQTRLFAPRLAGLCDLALLTTYGLHGGSLDWHGLKVYPGGADPFANDAIPLAAKDWQADIIITLKDTFVFNPQAFQGLRWCVPGHTLVTLADGREVTIESLVTSRAPAKVIGWDGHQAVEADILDYQCIPSRVSGEIVEVTTEDGHQLDVTAENQVLIQRGDAIEWLDAGCIVPGDVVYCYISIPIKRGDNGTTQGHVRQGIGAHQRVSAGTHADGVGLLRGDYRWRGNGIHHQDSEAGPLVATAAPLCDEYQRSPGGVAWGEVGDGSQRAKPTGSKRTVYQRHEDKLSDFNTGLSLVSSDKEYRALPDYQEGARADRDAVHGEPDATAVQRAIYAGGDRSLVACEGFEPRRVSGVQRRGRPYEVVYDLTTSTGNFVAGGILIHNCPLVPIDHEPAPPAVLGAVRHAYRSIAYAPNGVRALQAAGLDPLYAPHAYDPALLYPGDRDTARQALGLPTDAFLVGTVAVNRGGVPSRKAWPQLIAGAGMARGRIPSLHYLAHTHHGMDRHEGAIPLPPLAGAAGLADRFIMPNEDVYKRGYTDDQMRTLYQALDVLLCVSLGEGFGIPTLEAQACGVPVIAGAWAAQEDLIWGGWALRRDRDALAFIDQQDAAVYIPHPEAIARALVKAHADLADPVKAAPIWRKALRGSGTHEVSRVVADHWRPTLQALADQIAQDGRRPRGVLRIVRPEEVLV